MEPEVSLPCPQEATSEPILPQIYPVHIRRPYLFKMRFTAVLCSTSRYPNLSISFRFCGYNFVHISHWSIRATCPTHLILV